MQNPYVQASLGIILIGLAVLIAAFLAAVGMSAIATAKTIARKERIKRLDITGEFLAWYQDHKDDMK